MAGQKLHEGFGGWISINNLLEKDVFVAVGNYFEGLESTNVIDEPTIILNALFIKDFSNPIDRARIGQVLKDESIDLIVWIGIFSLRMFQSQASQETLMLTSLASAFKFFRL